MNKEKTNGKTKNRIKIKKRHLTERETRAHKKRTPGGSLLSSLGLALTNLSTFIFVVKKETKNKSHFKTTDCELSLIDVVRDFLFFLVEIINFFFVFLSLVLFF